YARLLMDPQLAPIFLDVAQIDLNAHLPLIKAYWRKLLLGDTDYQRHTMNIHRAVHVRRSLQPADFQRWLDLFMATVDEYFEGSQAERAKRIAQAIAANMQKSLAARLGSPKEPL
ncbi:group III truncated hemoglobin, partial [Marinobacter alexandrii]|uniref:group III truncated hemoglobin n=1 Tax=Marinobacter alexandrii TaxID=2570351 RepID=UPI0032998B8A